jgi:hypothetical protein
MPLNFIYLVTEFILKVWFNYDHTHILYTEFIFFFKRWAFTWTMLSSGMWRFVTLVKTDVSEEGVASIIKVTRISELIIMLAVISNWSTLQRNILLTLFLARWFFSPWWLRRYVPPKLLLLRESHDLTAQKTAFFSFERSFLKEIF